MINVSAPTRPPRYARRRTAAASAIVAASLLLAGCAGGGRSDPATKNPVPLPSPTSTRQEMSQSNLGYTWPLTVDRGTAECRERDQAVFTAPNGKTYALNERAKEAGYPDIGPLRATGHGGKPISIGSLLSKTMRLCRVSG